MQCKNITPQNKKREKRCILIRFLDRTQPTPRGTRHVKDQVLKYYIGMDRVPCVRVHKVEFHSGAYLLKSKLLEMNDLSIYGTFLNF